MAIIGFRSSIKAVASGAVAGIVMERNIRTY